MTDAELAYSDPRGARVLRDALAEYLGRVRGVVAVPGRVLVTSGYTQGLDVVLHALAARGARMLAVEDPSDPEAEWSATRAGLRSVRVAVDDEGIRVDALAASGADAVVLTPAHQHPTGVVLSSARRAELVAWLRERGAVAIEDDYDAEYRYDRAAVGALQGLDPEHVVYAGSASKTLAPALRLGWLVLPPGLVEPVAHQKLLADRGTARIEQHALADFLARGSSTATCGACASGTARGATRSSRRWPRSCPRRGSGASPPACTRRSSWPRATTRRRSWRRRRGGGSA